MEDHFAGTSEMHGAGGEWRVERQRLSWKLLDAFQQAAAQTGIASVEDFNGGDNEGCGYFQVNQRGGVRWNASKGFLRGIAQRANLTVLTHAEVQRVLLEDGRARALSVRWQGREQRFEARREIVLSAGAIGSPCLLQRSGIGPRDLLERLGAGVVHELPGVGGNLQDHLQLRMIYKVDGVPTLNQIAGSLWGKLGMGLRYLASRSGPLSMAPSQLGAFARSDPQQPSANLEYHVQPLSLDRFGEPLHAFPAFTASVCDLRPHSRGTVRIRSLDPGEAPSIQPNYLSDPRDLKVAADAIRLTRRIAAAPWPPSVRRSTSPARNTAAKRICSARGRSAPPSSTLPAPAAWGRGRQWWMRNEGARNPRPAYRRCLDHAQPDLRQHLFAGAGDCREGGADDSRRAPPRGAPQVVESAMAAGGREAVEA